MGNHPRKYAKSGGTCAVLLAVAAMCFVLVRREGDMLFRAQELSLFLCSRHFFETLCIYPGGTLSWLSCLATTAFHSRVETFVMLYLLWGACCIPVFTLSLFILFSPLLSFMQIFSFFPFTSSPNI